MIEVRTRGKSWSLVILKISPFIFINPRLFFSLYLVTAPRIAYALQAYTLHWLQAKAMKRRTVYIVI